MQHSDLDLPNKYHGHLIAIALHIDMPTPPTLPLCNYKATPYGSLPVDLHATEAAVQHHFLFGRHEMVKSLIRGACQHKKYSELF